MTGTRAASTSVMTRARAEHTLVATRFAKTVRRPEPAHARRARQLGTTETQPRLRAPSRSVTRARDAGRGRHGQSCLRKPKPQNALFLSGPPNGFVLQLREAARGRYVAHPAAPCEAFGCYHVCEGAACSNASTKRVAASRQLQALVREPSSSKFATLSRPESSPLAPVPWTPRLSFSVFRTTQAVETQRAPSRNDARSEASAARGTRPLRARSRDADTSTWTQPKRPEPVRAGCAQPESAADRISLDCGAIKAALVRSTMTRHRRPRGRESSTDIGERALVPERTSTRSHRVSSDAFAARGPTDDSPSSEKNVNRRGLDLRRRTPTALALPLESP